MYKPKHEEYDDKKNFIIDKHPFHLHSLPFSNGNSGMQN